MGKITVGIKVKCIDDLFEDDRTNPFKIADLNLPEKGEVYTVRSVINTSYGTGIRLEEIENKKYYFDNIGQREEPIFNINKFEPYSQ